MVVLVAICSITLLRLNHTKQILDKFFFKFSKFAIRECMTPPSFTHTKGVMSNREQFNDFFNIKEKM